MATKPRRSVTEWRDLLARYDRSGQTQQAFCDRHGLALSTFCKWRRELGEPAASEAVFAEVSLTDERVAPDSCWDVELTLGLGVVLRIRAG